MWDVFVCLSELRQALSYELISSFLGRILKRGVEAPNAWPTEWYSGTSLCVCVCVGLHASQPLSV